MTFTTRGQSDVSERMRILWSGGLAFGGAANYGTAGQILQTNANASPTWVDASTVIGGPYLPLDGGTLTGDLNLGTTSAPVDLYLFGDTAGTSLTWSNSDDELQFSDNTKVTFGDSGDLQVYYDGVDGAIKSATGIQFLANSATKMTLTSGGNLGINTSSPSFKLDLKTSSNDDGFSLSATSGRKGIELLLDSGINGGGDIRMYTGSNVFTNRITAQGSSFINGGNLGIGTSSPTSFNAGANKLVVGDGSNFQGITVNSVVEGNIYFADGTLSSQTYEGVIGYNHSNNFMHFYTNHTERMRLTSGGSLLLGTTTDSGYKLQVDGSIRQTANNPILIINNQGSSQTGTLYFRDQFGGATIGARVQTAGGALGLRTATSGDDDLIIDGSGNTTLSGSLTGTTATFSGQVSSLQYSVGDSNAFVFRDSNSLTLLTYAGYPITIKPNNSESTRFLANGNVLIGTTTDNGQQLQVTGNVRITGSFQVANTGGFLLADIGGSMRYGLKYGAAGAVGSTNLMMLTNRSLSSATGGGEVAIAANASTTGVTETEVMRIKANTQSQVSIDGVLSLTSQNTPADPPNRASTIWLDSNFDLKIKITNNSGVTVTKTLAEYA